MTSDEVANREVLAALSHASLRFGSTENKFKFGHMTGHALADRGMVQSEQAPSAGHLSRTGAPRNTGISLHSIGSISIVIVLPLQWSLERDHLK